MAIIKLPIHKRGAFIKMLMSPFTKFCTCITSLVKSSHQGSFIEFIQILERKNLNVAK